MPAKKFICPDETHVAIVDCLQACRMEERCMLLPTLRAVANSLERNISGFTVTELISGIRETFLKKTADYAVNPQKRIYAIHGTAAHLINDGHTEGNILSEERLFGQVCSGQFDLYGAILDTDAATLGDIKVTSSYKLMKALGYYRVEVPTGEIYKTGSRKGQPKMSKEWRSGGVRHMLDWAIQINYYRMLLEAQGFPVKRMVIQALCRDSGLRIASERNISQAVYLIEINKISDRWIMRYLARKAGLLQEALDTKNIPVTCSRRERWHGRKCAGFCEVSSYCSFSDGGVQHREVA